jgi:Fe-Mn family superoxide dismutase
MGFTKYAAKDYGRLRGLQAITDEQVEVHLQLYQGYVNRTNALQERLFAQAAEGTFDNGWQELKRRAGWEWNGMRLHELYFDGLSPGGSGRPEEGPLADLARRQFGSLDAWKADLLATAKLPGVGWAVAYHDPASGQLLNGWVNQHEVGHLAGARPVLVLDVWEHAFSVYRRPTERAKYLDDWFANVAWDVVAARLG